MLDGSMTFFLSFSSPFSFFSFFEVIPTMLLTSVDEQQINALNERVSLTKLRLLDDIFERKVIGTNLNMK